MLVILGLIFYQYKSSHDITKNTKLKLTEFASSLKAKYIAAGYYSAQIESNIEVDAQNRIGVELNINQGTSATINSMTISGATKFTEKKAVFIVSNSALFLLINAIISLS